MLLTVSFSHPGQFHRHLLGQLLAQIRWKLSWWVGAFQLHWMSSYREVAYYCADVVYLLQWGVWGINLLVLQKRPTQIISYKWLHITETPLINYSREDKQQNRGRRKRLRLCMESPMREFQGKRLVHYCGKPSYRRPQPLSLKVKGH